MRRPAIFFGAALSFLLAYGVQAQAQGLLFDCPQAKDSDSLTACAEQHLNALEKHPALPHYSPGTGADFYKQLDGLPASSSYRDSLAQFTLRARLGEWLYFSTPAYGESEKTPDSYDMVRPDNFFMSTEVYRIAPDEYLLQYWVYSDMRNVVCRMIVLRADGTLVPLQAETLDDKKLTLETADFSEPQFDPKTRTLSDGSRLADASYRSDYVLDGHVFRLQRITEYKDTATEAAAIKKIIYQRKK